MSKYEFEPSGVLGERVVFKNGHGAMIISSVREVLEIAANGDKEDSKFSAYPSQQQAQAAVAKLNLQMA